MIKSAAIASPHPKAFVPLSILLNNNDFTCSIKQPVIQSCQLNPGCRVTYNLVFITLYS